MDEQLVTSGGIAQPRRMLGVLNPARASRILLVAVAYYLAAQVGYALDVAGPVAALVWFPAGVGIAALAVGGLPLWPGVLIGDLLVNDYSVLPLGTALMQTTGNLLEMLVAAWLIRRIPASRPPLGSADGLGRLGLALAAGTAISASIGVVAQLLGGVIDPAEAAGVWRTWWLGDTAGAVTLVPLALAWIPLPPRAWWRGRVPEAILALVVLAVVCQLVFNTPQPLTYLVFPPLLWAALRFGKRGATVAILVMVAFSSWHTAHLGGPFVFSSISHGVLSTQLFILAAASTTLALAAVVAEREDYAAGLTASRARLVGAAAEERRRLEHNLHDGAQQRLTALGVRLRLARESQAADPAEADAALAEAEQQLDLAVVELRELAHGIHPAVLTRRGLPAAFESIAARSAIPIEVLAVPAVRLSPSVEATAYYVVAEAVTNAQKHSGAQSIRVRGSLSRGLLRIEVADDGIGGAAEAPGSGLEGLRDRVDAVGGTFELASARGRGTRVSASIPALED
jgi:signal transduction histidine kinase